MPLTPEQMMQYREEGYAIGGQLLDEHELSRLRREIEKVIEALPEDRRPENMPAVHYENVYLRDLFLSDKLVNVAEQILGPDIALFTTYIISKRPGDGLPVDWHQDAAFFPIEPMETFTLWLAVDDSDVENGCMRVLPGTHKDRRVWPHKVDQESGTTLPLALEGLDLSDARDVEVKAGAFSVHDTFILHGSNANRSSRRRCGITIKYIPTYVNIDRTWVSPTGFDWNGIRLYLARGRGGNHEYYDG